MADFVRVVLALLPAVAALVAAWLVERPGGIRRLLRRRPRS